MKKTALTIAAILTSLDLFAQGTVFLSNRTTPGTTHVWGAGIGWLQGNGSNDTPPGTTPYEANGYVLIGANGTGGKFGAATTFAQLLAANGANQSEASLVPMGQTTTFRTGARAGNLAEITVTLTGIPADSPAATMELAVWDNSSGYYPTWTEARPAWMSGLIIAGLSGTFNVFDIGGSTHTPPGLVIPTFGIAVPEPATVTLALLGGASLLLFRRRK